MTPVVKLVFGMDYDKTRLTEFAAALSYAARNDVKPGHLQALLEGYEGGLKGVVAAERAMRRPAESGRLAHSIEVRQWLRSAAPAVHIDFAPEGEEEFVLLVADRKSTRLSVIYSVPPHDALGARALVQMTCTPADNDPKPPPRGRLLG